jgi:hypothetical protein
MEQHPKPRRPTPDADLTELIEAVASPQSRAEIASVTAALVIAAGRDGGPTVGARLVSLADVVGLDTLAALWRDADPVSLPGALWTLYLLRQWCHVQADEVCRLWRVGAGYGEADALVAGVDNDADSDAVAAMTDAILHSAYRGDFAVALERAAACFRVIATGRRHAARCEDPAAEYQRAQRNEQAARDLIRAARLWRAGMLR